MQPNAIKTMPERRGSLAVSMDTSIFLNGEEEAVYKFRRGAQRKVVHVERLETKDARLFKAMRTFFAPACLFEET